MSKEERLLAMELAFAFGYGSADALLSQLSVGQWVDWVEIVAEHDRVKRKVLGVRDEH